MHSLLICAIVRRLQNTIIATHHAPSTLLTASTPGYHSDDGSKWRSDLTHGNSDGLDGEPYAAAYGGESCEPFDDFLLPRTGEGDFVGCGVDLDTRQVPIRTPIAVVVLGG